MAKFHGNIGFAHYDNETNPGLVQEMIIEKPYYGEFPRISRRLQSNGTVNDDVTFNNDISILADSYLTDNIGAIRYVRFMGAKWKVESIEVAYPRIILHMGVLYNG